ncbi:MAG: hypothetical protein E7112_00830 [Bacteroidales bacterium]|nr:hypothetical protein [Bacteroidales bacterium]
MGTLTTEQKKSLAKELYIQGTYTYAEIAEKVGSTRQTISKWAEAGKWDELKTYATAGKDRILKNIYLRIEQLTQKTLDWERIVKEHNGNVPAALMIMAPSKGQADEIIKLSAAAKKLESEMNIAGLVDAGIGFCNFMRTIDLDEAKKIAKYWDMFLTDQMK